MFAEDYEPDLRPMIVQMCVLCTHDQLDDIPVVWPNGATAHPRCNYLAGGYTGL